MGGEQLELGAARNAVLHTDISGGALRAALTDAVESWLRAHAQRCALPSEGIALLAVGALGRRDMMAHSDLDLVLLHDNCPDDELSDIGARLWYPMWDSGVGLDHSVRTPNQALKVASTDLPAALGLLEARVIAGDEEFAEALIGKARAQWRRGLRARTGQILESTRSRWQSAGELASRAEPDIKNGRGGLRDVQVLHALALAQVIDRPGATVAAARDFLLDVRGELHRGAKRAREVLRAQDGDDVAAALGVGDKFDLARKLSAAGRAVAFAMDGAMRSLAPRRARISRRGLDEGVVAHGDNVALARQANPRTDQALLLRVAAASARHDLPIATGTLSMLAERASLPVAPWPDTVRHHLMVLLGSGQGLVDVVEALEATGLWGRLFPEWAAVRDLPPRDAPHVYTVDRHLVATCVHACQLTTTVSRPDLLLIAALVHDIGKGRGEDHSIVGARLAVDIGTRIGLPAQDVHTLAMMVRHHLLLPHTATRRDIADAMTIDRVVRTLDGDVVLLELLAALAEADSLATGPGVWSPWKANLITQLVDGVRRAIVQQIVPAARGLDEADRALARRCVESGRVELDSHQRGEVLWLSIATADRPGVLSRACAVLVLAGLRVHSCDLSTVDTTSVITCGVSPRFGSVPDAAALREQLRLADRGALPLAERIAAKEQDYARSVRASAKPVLLWFDDEASAAAVLEVRAPDEIGLLYRITAVLESCGTDIRWARAITVGPTADNSFCLVDSAGAPPSVQLREAVELALRSALTFGYHATT